MKLRTKFDTIGTGINNLTNEHFSKTIFSFPPNKIISDFNMKVEKIYQQLGIFEQENMKLISLRNSLLPLLMNGQVTLNSCLSQYFNFVFYMF